VRQLAPWLVVVCFTPLLAQAQPAERHAIIVGNNDGGEARERLRFAESDAAEVASVLERLGGVSSLHRVILLGEARQPLEAAFAEVGAALEQARAAGRRTELVFYYSGHADEEALLLGPTRLPYVELRAALDSLPADVRVAIVDSCASGALTRGKGGLRRPAFLLDEGTAVKGHAYLTSASADEEAQESDRIGASFFTHYLLSGLRGAADTSGDGRVTLGEAYRFAYDETLARTERTRIGPQHPSYDVKLVGQGDLVLTEVRGASAQIALLEDIVGQVLVRHGEGHLVAELNKREGTIVHLGLDAARYDITLKAEELLFGGSVELGAADVRSVGLSDLLPLEGELARPRGGHDEPEVPERLVHPIPHDPERRPRVFVPVHVGLVPFVGVNTIYGNHTINVVSVDAFFGWSERVRGAALGGLGVSVVTDEMYGPQLSLIGNVAAHRFAGLQAGVLANVAMDGYGGQAAVGFNYAHHLRGAQVAAINFAPRVQGVQAGFINIAGEVDGAQVGFLNLALDVNGASFGLLNLIWSGYNHLGVHASDLAAANISATLGTKHLYTLYTLGMDPFADAAVLQIGVGGHIPINDFFVDIDVAAGHVAEGFKITGRDPPDQLLTRLRIGGGWQPLDYFGVYGGVAINGLADFTGARRRVGYVDLEGTIFDNGNEYYRTWPGAYFGVRL
jgi:hypothetical protein